MGVYRWVVSKDWMTWLSHAGLAVFLAVAAKSTVPCASWDAALLLGVGGYGWRELGQVIDQINVEGWRSLRRNGFDHFMDVVVPFLLLGLWVAYR